MGCLAYYRFIPIRILPFRTYFTCHFQSSKEAKNSILTELKTMSRKQKHRVKRYFCCACLRFWKSLVCPFAPLFSVNAGLTNHSKQSEWRIRFFRNVNFYNRFTIRTNPCFMRTLFLFIKRKPPLLEEGYYIFIAPILQPFWHYAGTETKFLNTAEKGTCSKYFCSKCAT